MGFEPNTRKATRKTASCGLYADPSTVRTMIYVDGGRPDQGAFGAAGQSTEDKVRKFCKDYGIPASNCAGLIQCAKERTWSICATEIAAAAAAGVCAVYLHPSLAPVCSGVTRWIVGMIGLTGTVTQPCSFGQLLREIDPPESPLALVESLNPGEFAVGPIPATGKFHIRWMVYSGPDCPDEDPLSLLKDAKFVEQKWEQSSLLQAVKDWDEREYLVQDNRLIPIEETGWRPPPEKPYVFQPLTVQYVPVTTGPGGYPVGSFAVLDSTIGKYRILAPL